MRWWLCGLLLVAATSMPAAAHAGDRLAEIRARGRLVVSVKNDAKHAHKDPAHEDKRGFELELAHALAAHIVGNPGALELRLLARPTRLPMLAAGAVDLVVSMIPVSDENTRLCAFSHPYFVSGMSLLLPDRGARPRTLAELDGKTIAFRKQAFNDHGAELVRIATERGVHVTVRYYPTFADAVAAVERGEALAMGGSSVDLEAWRKSHVGFTVDASLFDERPVAVAVKKGEPALLRVVDETIDALRRSGELERMTRKWHLPYRLPGG